jgi:hypothetical protein
MKDLERLDLPSASSFEIVVACPGQPNLKAELPDNVVEVVDDLAPVGERIHKARETESAVELDLDEFEIYTAGREYEEKLIAAWRSQMNLVRYEEGARELRLWLHDDSAERAVSAKLDVHYLGWDADDALHVLICDWKTGWSWNLTPSQRNWQLRVQGVLIWREHNGVQSVRVGFVKPIATSDRLDFTDYFPSDLEKSQEAIFQAVWLSKQPDAQRVAGNHCNYCPCKSICREAAAWALLPSVVNQKINVASPKDIAFLVEQMTNEDLALVHRRAGVIVKILESVKARLKTLSDEDLTAIGLTKVPGRRLDPIVKTKEAFDFLRQKYNISEAELWASLSFSKGELVDALRRDQGWAKKVADGFVRGQLQPFIEEKRAQESIDTL